MSLVKIITTTMAWHPKLPDILGIKIINKFVSVIKHNNDYKCVTKDGMFPVKFEEAFAAYLDVQHKFVNSSARFNACEELELVFDFKNQRVLFTADPHIHILSEQNVYLDDEICPESFFNLPLSCEHIKNRISQVNPRIFGGNMVYEENHLAQIVSLKGWREKMLEVG